MDKLEHVDCAQLREIYDLVDKIKGYEIKAANVGHKVNYTRMRTNLSAVARLCKDARKRLLELRDGK